jgi:hypothetical protein
MTKQGKNTVTYSGLAVHRSNALCNTAQGGQVIVLFIVYSHTS